MQINRRVEAAHSLPESDTGREPERFVDSLVAAKFLSIKPRQLLELARKGTILAYPLGEGQRRIWRFRLSDLAEAMEQRMIHRKGAGNIGVNQPRSIR
jgi:hypothetical protein